MRTTILPAVQDAGEAAVADGLRRLGKPDLQAALVALDPDTGNVLAIVGGSNIRDTPFNRAWRSRRQPGSAFKPFVFAAALMHGMSPVTVVDGLGAVGTQGDEEWSPRNARGEAVEALTLRQALIESNNRAAVALQQRIGTRPILRLAFAAGLRNQPDVPSLALGSGLVTPLDLAAAYSVFPNGGFKVTPRAIRRVIDEDGDIVLDEPSDPERILPAPVAFQMVSMMRDVIDRGTGSGVRAAGVRFPVAGKTGTTNDFKDAWFVGYSTTVVAAVWVGYDQPAHDWARCVRQPGGAPDLGRLHAPHGPDAQAARVHDSGRSEGTGAVQDFLPASCRRLSDLHRILQGWRRRSPAALHHPPRNAQTTGTASHPGILLGNAAAAS